MKTLKILIIVISAGLLALSGALFGQSQQIVDYEGNYYNIVTIGSQTWMQENLTTTKYNDGTDIPIETDGNTWISLTSPAYCWYENDPTTYKDTYGALYNWHTANSDKLCPSGWHVPTDAEWTTLTNYLGGLAVAGKKLKETGYVHWSDYNKATNESGFTALPGGYRGSAGVGGFLYVRSRAVFWSSTENADPTGTAWLRSISTGENVARSWSYRQAGFSIRCMHDGGTLITTPGLTTTEASSITQTAAQSGGNVTNEGGVTVTARGVCWSTSQNPTISDSHTTDGNGTGSFTSNITGLTPNTTYYVRAYATNSVGTAYGSEVTFTTLLTVQQRLDEGETPYQIYQSDNSLLNSLYGKSYEGGLIFYLNTSDGSGFVSASSDQSTSIQWYNGSYISTGATGTAIGTGQTNTTNIVNAQGVGSYAAQLCNDLSLNGYSDWFLPSKDELNAMYTNLHQKGLGAFDNLYYYSSTEYDYRFAWSQNFLGGYQDHASYTKLQPYRVRAVLAFLRCKAGITPDPAETCEGVGLGLNGNPAGGSGTYSTHSWTGAGATSLSATDIVDPTFTNGTAGTYALTYTVTDDEGCIASDDITVTVNDVDGGTIAADQTICNGDNPTGFASTVDGSGDGAITYQWQASPDNSTWTDIGGAVNSTYDAPALTQTMYYKRVTTSTLNGKVCTAESNVLTITVNPLPTATEPTVTDISCYDGNDGAINLSVSGGAAPYSFAWTGPDNYSSTDKNPGSLGAGVYEVTVTDDNGCTTFATATITQPDALSIVVDDITDESCTGCSDGAITITVSGGTPDYSYAWTGPNGYSSTVKDIVNLEAGEYTVTVTDGNGCFKTLSAEVINPFKVINIDDNGPGSLRFAIYAANSTTGITENIKFDIPGEGPHTIQPLLPLPDITDPVIIDGYTQPGASPSTSTSPAVLKIELAGSNAGIANGLTITAGNSIVRGLVINNFYNSGILIENGEGNIIEGNFIGTDNTGTSIQSNGQGVLIASSNNTIGGTTEGDRNIISGNSGYGVLISGTTGTDNIIIANFIGTDINGTNDLGNDEGGIWIGNGASYNRIGGTTSSERNIISANGVNPPPDLPSSKHGVVISDVGSTGNKITGNYIGLDVTGKSALGNGGDGVQIINGASGNTIGGITPGERNIISGNGVTGIAIYGGANENNILGNYIGLDATGTKNIGHPNGTGVYIGGGASNNIVGGTAYGAGNFISGNTGWAGVAIDSTGTDSNVVTGNLMGINIYGETGFGNKIGVRIYNGASNNQIGGMENGEGNLIAYSEEDGVLIYNDPNDPNPTQTIGNLILSNLIHSNDSLGIDLGYDGVTYNDKGDGDGSPNNLQNYPVLESINFSPGTVTVGGYLNSTPNTDFTLQFFASKVSDHSTYGEGQTYLGSELVTTDGNGDTTFTFTFPILGISGQVITATATDPGGNTSEFSKAIGGVKDQILADINRPFYFSVNEDGVPNISDGSDMDAVESAFQTWSDIPTADIEFISSGATSAKYASATDGVNLVTFRDEKFLFAPGILAVVAKTLKIDPSSQVAEILDADIVFNPDFVNHADYNLRFGVGDVGFDIQSVTTHEIGHVLALIHTGVVNSTMFFMLGSGIEVRSLEQDDIAWASYRYPGPGYSSLYGFISGKVTYGDIGESGPPATHPPVAGALVLAINTGTQEKIHAYTDADGNYTVPVPVSGAGSESYWIYIQPLDGDVFGYNLRPGNISSYIYSNTIHTDFPNEFYNGENEGATDDPLKATDITVSAGETIVDIDLITNRDDTPPYVVSVSPSNGSENIDIFPDIIIMFSEPVEEITLSGETCYLSFENVDSETVLAYGDFTVLGESSEKIIFTPEEALNYSTDYILHITTGVTDLKGNPLDPDPEFSFNTEYTSSFTTIPPDIEAPEVTDIIPENGTDSVFVTSEILVFFSKPMDKNTVADGFTLSCDGNPDVEGSYDWNPENTLLTFTPLRSLLEGTEYSISLSTDIITDLSGNALVSNSVFTFTTVPEASPEILYLGPKNGDLNVTVETSVVVDFSEPINTATITLSTFNLLSLDGTPVSGSFEFLMEDSRVVFRPDENLNFSQAYEIILVGCNSSNGDICDDPCIYDVSATPLPLEFTRTATFTTADGTGGPQITYLDPPSGVIGSVVTIAGSGFDPNPANNTVIFNGTPAPVTNSSLSSLAVAVPLGAISGPVTVSVNGSDPSNFMYFYVIPQSLDPCDDIIANVNTGSRSRDVAINPEAGLAYVTNSGSGTVSVIALNLGVPIETITVGETPLKIDINPQGTLAYVTNFTSHTVSVIDLQINKVIETIHVGVNPYGVVVSPDGKVYVSNYTSENVSVIDVDPTSGGFNHVIANVNTGTRNRDIDVTPDAGLVLVTGDNGLTIINSDPADINFNSVIANVNSGSRTRDVAVTPDAGLAIVSTMDGNLLIIDIYPTSNSFGAVIANVNTGSRARDLAVSPDAMFVYVTLTDPDEVAVYRLGYGGGVNADGSYYSDITLTLHNTIPVGDEPEGIVIDPDAEMLVVVNSTSSDGNGTVTVVSICCGPVSPLKSIGDLIIAIQNMINAGTLNEGQGNALITKLNNALTKLGKGQTKVAINVLHAFINQVTGLMNGGEIPAEQATAIIDATNAIIDQLEDTKKSYVINTGVEDHGLQKKNTGIEGPGLQLESALGLIYPNPFGFSTTIHYAVSAENDIPVQVWLMVYNITGQVVANLVDKKMTSGRYIVEWDGRYEDGRKAPDGNYFIRFRAGYVQNVKKIVILK